MTRQLRLSAHLSKEDTAPINPQQKCRYFYTDIAVTVCYIQTRRTNAKIVWQVAHEPVREVVRLTIEPDKLHRGYGACQ